MAIHKRLTDTGLTKLKPPETGTVEYADTVVKKLYLRHSATDVKSWRFAYRFGGQQRRMTLGRYPEISLTQARKMVMKGKEEVAIGLDPCVLQKEKIMKQLEQEALGVTVEDIYHEFFEKHARKNRQWKETKHVFTAYILPAMGNMSAQKIRRRDVMKLLDERKNSKGPSSANKTLVGLRRMYSWAIEQGKLEFNPCSNIKKPVPIQERERVLNRKEILAFWRACDRLGYPYGPLCQLLLLTGQRRSEIAKLKKSYIDLDDKIIRIPASNVKAKREQHVPLSGLAVDILKSLPHFAGPFIFTTCFGQKPVDGFGKAKSKFEGLFDAEDWRYHDLRRTCATGMAEMGVPLHTISRVLNHAEGGVTKIYARHSYLNEKREALNLWAGHVQNILKSNETDYESL
ncbi:MAG: tyrosine-type recombinase/integrase [Rhodospirillales bacterium]|nr:tyrosine-type recombinase/integrase [Rhodospirillales bacterium]